MRLTITVDPKWFELAIEDQRRRRSKRFTAAMRKVATHLQGEMRGQVRGAGLGDNLARAVRMESYPKVRDARYPAALVYSKATTLHRVFNEGATITARGRKWLAIPTEEAARQGFATQYTGRNGRELSGAAIPRWASNIRKAASAYELHVEFEDGRRGRIVGERNGRRVVLFILVRSVRIAKRIDLGSAARAAQEQLRHDIEIAAQD